MLYLLDTDTLVFYLRGRFEVRQKALSVPANDLCTSAMCIGELYYGAAKSQKQVERKAEVDRLRAALTSIPLQGAVMERFGQLKASLEAQSQRLADADLLIASTALEYNLTLVTGNLKHFQRVQGLKMESWIKR